MTAATTTLTGQIATVLEGITGLELVGFGWVPGGAMGFPVAFVETAASQEIGQAYTWTELSINVYVLFGDVSGGRDVQELRDDALTGVSSVATALRADETFSGACLSSVVTGPSRTIYRDAAGYQAWGVQWELKALMTA